MPSVPGVSAVSVRPSENEKTIRRPADVCTELDIQPYVLKFWEGEFPHLGRRIGPKRHYTPEAVAIAREIRRLLEEEGQSMGEARKSLDRSFPPESSGESPAPSLPLEPAAAPAAPAAQESIVSKTRIEELEHQTARLEADVQQLKAELEESRGALIRLEDDRSQERQQAEEKIESLTGQLQSARADRERFAEADSRLAEMDLALARAREEQADTIAELRLELEGERTRVIHLQEELNRSWGEAGDLRDSRQKIEAEFNDLEQARAQLEQDSAARIAALEAAIDQLREPAALSVVLKAQLEDLSRRAGDLEEELGARQGDVEQLSSELEAERRAFAAAQADAVQLPGALARAGVLENELSAARDLAASQASELDRLADAAERIEKLERELSEAQEIAAAHSGAAQVLPGIRERLSAVEQVRDQLAGQLHERDSRIQSQDRELSKRQEMIAGQQESISTLEELLATAETERDALKTLAQTEVSSALAEARRIAAQAARLSQTIAEAALVPRSATGPAEPTSDGEEKPQAT